eukprot:10808774-Ditylum_brightwellii.AAC.1
MNTCCYLGEQLLKTEAKCIPRIAQKCGKETFTQQTCQQIAERAVFDHFGHLMKESEEKKEAESSPRETSDGALPSDKQAVDSFLQKEPTLKIYKEGEEVKAFSSEDKGRKPDKSSKNLDKNLSRKYQH